MVDISIITPVWNRSDLTQKFLFYNWSMYYNNPEIEFVVVNNGSIDNTGQILDQWQQRMGERLVVVHNEDNRGFSGGNNDGAKFANSSNFIFLSNDVQPVGGYVHPILKALKGDRDILIGAELFDWDTGWNTFNDKVIPYLAGWCIACSKRVYEKLGGWDERYFPCDYEDIDLSKTAIEKGMVLLPLSLKLRHEFGQSAKNLDGGREQITMQSQAKFIEKWGYS